MREAVQAGYCVLRRGSTALDAVEAAVRCFEDNPLFDAGNGSTLNEIGEVEVDAMITDGHAMITDGHSLKSGAVVSCCLVGVVISWARD